MAAEVEKWGLFEAAFPGPKDGNPFADVTLDVDFGRENRRVAAPASMTATVSTAFASCRTRRGSGRFARVRTPPRSRP